MKREHFKVLFLDIDGVVNNRKTRERQGDTKFIGIKPELADRVRRIIAETGCKVVLSSSWRLFPDSKKWAEENVCEFFDVTADLQGQLEGEPLVDLDRRRGSRSALHR